MGRVQVFISFDMEGVAGIVDWSQCRAPGQPYEEGRRLLLGEVNAAIEGAVAGGATEIVCNDSHGTMFNLDPAALRGRAAYVAGRHKPMYMMQGLADSADAVFMIGYHGSVSGDSSVLSHTYNPQVISHVELNGGRVGESGINALVALGHRVPIALISGDRQTIAEAGPFLDEQAARVVVKESFTRFGAASVHPDTACAMIADAARTAAEHAKAMRPPAIDLPATLDLQLHTADMAEVASWVRGVERTGTRAVRIEGDDPIAVYRSFVAVTYITRVSEGRLALGEQGVRSRSPRPRRSGGRRPSAPAWRPSPAARS
jgi:D-amino peptidase